MKIKINGEGMIAAAMYLLVFYLCLPFSMILLNSMMIRLIMLISTCLLFGGMIVLKKEKQIFSLSILFSPFLPRTMKNSISLLTRSDMSESLHNMSSWTSSPLKSLMSFYFRLQSLSLLRS